MAAALDRRPQRRREAVLLEQSRIDALREQRQRAQRPFERAARLVEQSPCLPERAFERPSQELELNCERDEVLLRALVQAALDSPAVGIAREDEPLAGGAKVVYLVAQPCERLPRPLTVGGLQGPVVLADLPICPS